MSSVFSHYTVHSKPAPKRVSSNVFWRIAEDIPPSLRWRLLGLSIAIPLFLWGFLSSLQIVDSQFLPSPLQVISALKSLWTSGLLLQDTSTSIIRVFAGFSLAAIVAVPIGIAMGAFASIRALLEPILGILRYMPPPAFIPLFVIYLGIGEEPKIALIFIGTIFFNILMIMDAVKFVPKELIETTYTLGGVRRQVLFRVIAPYVVPSIIDTFRVNIATSWSLLVVAELVAAEQGLGKRILLAQRFFKTDEIFACLIVLGLIGFSIDMTCRWLQHKTCRWSID
ncbi:ABC transporter permease [Synechococcus sp. PCC 7336]|uniref:ABC transporter permease n=1 Tax=Synechococcus sp. PCC 7336 TaxID=195250 RepID=UPI000348B10C|nr:ABC transporter permease [Synechococcus sp. PCC 7336]